MRFMVVVSPGTGTLNESPSEKEGKCAAIERPLIGITSLNESPSEKEGKWPSGFGKTTTILETLNESPSEKEGKFHRVDVLGRRF